MGCDGYTRGLNGMLHGVRQKAVLFILLTYTVLQFVCLFMFGYTPYPDSEGYILLAKECVANCTFYPVNLDDIYFLWNIGAINAVVLSFYMFNSVFPLLLLYTLMQGLTALLAYLIALELFGRRNAFISLCLFVLYPAGYGCGTSVLSEVPFVFFSMLALYFSLRNKLMFGGICLAIANYFRPMAIIYIVALLLFMVMKRASMRKYVCLLVGFFLVTCSVGTVNYVLKGRYFTQGAMGWMGLMQYSWDHDSNKEDDYALFAGGDPNKIDDALGYNSLQRDSVWRSHFLIWLSNNKGEYLMQMPEKVFRTYVSDNVNLCAFLPDKHDREYMYKEISMAGLSKDFPCWSPVQVLTVMNLMYYYLLLFLGLLGCFSCLKNKKICEMAIPVAVILAGTGLIMLVGHGEARFHQPFMPMFIMLAASFLEGVSYKCCMKH